jgi:nucleoside-diphosphate-sugar epimerase
MHVLVAGAGWMGSALARALVARGDRVTAVRRDPDRLRDLAALGAAPLALDLAEPASAARIPPDVEAVVAAQSASGDGAEPYRRAYVDANRTLLAAAARRPVRAFVYTGSTGVFGQRDGREVDERTPPEPAGPAAGVLLEAERLVLGGAAPGMVLRLSGLYGPGRGWIVDRVRRGLLALGPGDDAWMNFCHLDDAVASVLAVLDRGVAGTIYHASDACPAPRREVVQWVAGRLGIAPPVAAEGAAGGRGAHRRIRADWTRERLGIALRYPSYREGVEAQLAAEAGAA